MCDESNVVVVREHRYILTASTASQTALEREGDDYGLLTKHIISGINQGAADADADGLVSMDDLYRYVYAKVKSEGYYEIVSRLHREQWQVGRFIEEWDLVE